VTAPLVDMPGVSVGHTTLASARTGCTVIRFDRSTLTAVDVRGAAPGTRELDLLAPGQSVQAVDAILLTGGSAFGLRAAEGVVAGLQAVGRGHPTPAGPVPIVPAAVIFDLTRGEPVAPSLEDGRQSFDRAVPISLAQHGAVGAGTGAQWGAISGTPRQGGIGIAQHPAGDGIVTAIVVLNAFGSVDGDHRAAYVESDLSTASTGQSTTLMSVITDVPCDHGTLMRMCISAHGALARRVIPAHTLLDGDLAFASTLQRGPVILQTSLRLCLATEMAMEAAIVQASKVGHSSSSGEEMLKPMLH
jgi:L-aminopeptidase/D-esterase-like protein